MYIIMYLYIYNFCRKYKQVQRNTRLQCPTTIRTAKNSFNSVHYAMWLPSEE